MTEYGQVVGAGSQVAGGGGGAASSSAHVGDPFGSLNALVHDASTAVAGLPPVALGALLIVGLFVVLLVLRRAL